MENKRVKKRIRSIAAAAAALSLALSFAYAEEIGIDRAGFGTAVTANAAELLLTMESVDCGASDPDDVRATYCFYHNENYGKLTISGNGDIDKSLLDTLTNKYKDQINGIVIENGITSIPEKCFYGFAFPSLETVEIGSSVSKIESGAFEDCGLSKVIFAENSSLEAIGERAFCSNNFTKIEFPDSVKTIESKAFYNCSALKGIEFDMFKSNLVSIGENTFENCSNLENLVLPKGVTTLGSNWLSSVNGYIACPEGLAGSIPASAVSFKYKVEGNDVVLTGVFNLGETVTVPDFITVIGEYAFDSFNSRHCENITLPDTITEIRNHAFYDCSSLKSMNIPKNVTDIGSYAFENCTALSNVNFEDGSKLSSISESVFKGCKVLTRIDIPQNVTNIGDAAFEGCIALSEVKFEDGSKLNSIGSFAFYNCKALNSIVIPENVIKLEASAFNSSGLKSVTIPKSVTEIDTAAFLGCKALSNVNFENGSKLSSIGELVFGYCTALESINIPENVTKIGKGTFVDSGLKSITIPKNVTDIGIDAFNMCKALSDVKFESGSKLNSIGANAFLECTSLTSIDIPESVATIGDNAFAYSGLKSVIVPKNVTFIYNTAFEECTALESIFISKDTLVYSGEMINTASKALYEIKDSKVYITEITLGDGRSDVAIPETICGFPVVFVDENYRRYVGAHTHVTEKEKSCTEGKICGICGNSYTAASGHDDSDSWKYDADDHWKICAREGCGEQIELEAHTFDNGVVTTEPTEYSEGVRTYTCIVCGYEKTEPIEKSDHTHKPSEKYTYDETEHWKTCTECNEKLDPEKHSFDEGVITTQPTADSEGVRTYTCTVCGYEKTESIEKLPEEPVKTYPIVISGDVTVNKSDASAGETVDVSAPFGYDIIVTDGSGRQIAKMTDKGSFKMPASGVRITAVRGEIFAHMSNAWSHSYVYSYDSDMNRIKVNSDVKRGVVTIDLGVNYAGRSFTVYSGRKSTSKKITEGVFDENGRYTFSSDEGRNYTLVLD